jgi:hypothetical protein
VIDEEHSTPTGDAVPRALGHSEEYEIIHAIARRFASITGSLLEVARRVDAMEGATRERTLIEVQERIERIARLILGPYDLGQPAKGARTPGK